MQPFFAPTPFTSLLRTWCSSAYAHDATPERLITEYCQTLHGNTCEDLSIDQVVGLYHRFDDGTWRTHVARLALTFFANTAQYDHADTRETIPAVAMWLPLFRLIIDDVRHGATPFCVLSVKQEWFDARLEQIRYVLNGIPPVGDVDCLLHLLAHPFSVEETANLVLQLQHMDDITLLPLTDLYRVLTALEASTAFTSDTTACMHLCADLGHDYHDNIYRQLLHPADSEYLPGPAYAHLQQALLLAEEHRFWRFIAMSLYVSSEPSSSHVKQLLQQFRLEHQDWFTGDALLDMLEITELTNVSMSDRHWPLWLEKFVAEDVKTMTRAAFWASRIPEWREHVATWDALDLSPLERLQQVRTLRTPYLAPPATPLPPDFSAPAA